jgi:hypothetical protein
LGLASGSANGALSSTDWTTFNNKQNALTNPITGTGAAGQVAFWNGTNTQTGSNNLFWNNTNSVLEIKSTGFPSDGVRINQNSNVSTLITGRTQSIEFRIISTISQSSPIDGAIPDLNQIGFVSNQAGINVVLGSTRTSAGGGVRYYSSLNGDNHSHRWYHNRSEQMRLAFSGNLLIGTTADAGFRLDVNGTARITSTLNTDADAVVNGVNIGRGGGNISSNTRVGVNALSSNTTGNNNSAFGISSLNSNTIGIQNTAIGRSSLSANISGNNQVSIGANSLVNNITGNNNVALGVGAGRFAGSGTTDMTSVSNSMYLGFQTRGLNATGSTNEIVIGYDVVGLGSNTTVLGNASTLSTAIYGDLLLGQTTDNGTDRLQITGTARVSSSITAGSFIRSGGTSTQYLMADGSVSTLSNAITGTGTTNFLPKFTGASTLGNSIVFDNGTNVGIGTTSPLTKLHLLANSPNYILLTNVAADGVPNAIQGGIIGQSRGYGNNLAQMASILLRNENSADWFKGEITFNTNGTDGTNPSITPTERMRITSTGNVGIGTTSPSERLHVVGNGLFSGSVTATAFFASSDIRLKDIIAHDGDMITYKWKDGRDDKIHYGYSAQNLQSINPNLVNKNDDGFLSVNYTETLVLKVRELEKRVKELEAN